MIDEGLCNICGKVPAAPGRKGCRACLDRAAARSRDRRPGYTKPAHAGESSKERYNRLKAAGTCVGCGANPAVEGRVHCPGCVERHRKYRECQGPGDPLRGTRPKNYAERRAVGLCGLCGKAPPAEGFANCRVCLDKTRSRQKKVKDANAQSKRELARDRAVQGVCVKCGLRGPAGGSTFCQLCLERARGTDRNHYLVKRLAGVCVNCDAAPEPGKVRCTPCQEGYKRARDELIRQGLCVRCKRPCVSGVWCPDCKASSQARHKAVRARRLSRGQCLRCGIPAKDSRLCAPCDAVNKVRCLLLRNRLKDAAFAAYGGYRCNCCGCERRTFLQLDHVNNDGAEHRRMLTGKNIGGGVRMYYWLRQNGYPTGLLQPLCANCNFEKAKSQDGRCHCQDPPPPPAPPNP